MGAAEHQRVGRIGFRKERLEIMRRGREGRGRIGPAFLGERHEHLAGLLHHVRTLHQPVNGLGIGAAIHRTFRRDHGDALVLRRGHAGPRAGLDHPDHRHRIPRLLQHVKPDGRGGIAGDHHHLHAFGEKETRGLQGIGLHGLGALRAVRKPCRVAEIDEALGGQPCRQRPQHGQSAHPGVEDPDRPAVTCHRALPRRLRNSAR